MKTVIIGAGLAGLAAGIKTGGTIFEASGRPGGLCRSYTSDGYMFEECAGHWIFGDPSIQGFVKYLVPCNDYVARAKVIPNIVAEYPFQTFLEKDNPCTEGSLKHWLLKKFGKHACEMFFYPYNRNYTNGLYDKIIQDDPAKSVTAGQTTHCPSFTYPVNGTSELIKVMADKNNIVYHKRVSAIDIKNKVLTFCDDTTEHYDRLISTIPLKFLMTMVGVHAHDLLFTGTNVVNIGGTRTDRTPEDHWIYFGETESGFHRVQFYSNVNKMFAPKHKRVSLCVETADIHVFKESIINEVQDMGFVGDIETSASFSHPITYTWLRPNHQREAYLEYLAENDIISIGRFGKWKFQGMAESIKDGLEVE